MISVCFFHSLHSVAVSMRGQDLRFPISAVGPTSSGLEARGGWHRKSIGDLAWSPIPSDQAFFVRLVKDLP